MGDDLHYCYNKGCGQKFNPIENDKDSCRYHPGPPYFHDAYKIWSCCKKKSTDFGTWLGFEGCTLGLHCDKKPEEEIKALRPETKIRPEAPEEVVVWSGLNKPADRSEISETMRPIKLEITDSAKSFLELNMAQQIAGDSKMKVEIGVSCKNPGCDKIYQGEESDKEECVYHCGTAVFHEGMKYWSCCERKTSDFSVFLDQKGCTVGSHVWSQAGRTEKVREDWFSGGGFIHINIYCKSAVPDLCQIESNGLILRLKILHSFGSKETELNYELFGKIDVDQSKVIITERKLEVVLKQVDIASWPRLTFDRKVTII